MPFTGFGGNRIGTILPTPGERVVNLQPLDVMPPFGGVAEGLEEMLLWQISANQK
jgi:hypothetical protein